MKIFRMNDVTEWVAANSLEEAVDFYIRWCIECGMDSEEIEYKEAVEETRLDLLIYVDENEGLKRTFRQQLEKFKTTEPYFFATTEY